MAICYNKNMQKWIIGVLLVAGIFYLFRDKETVKNFPNNNQTIVAFGDSLTAGYGGHGHSYPAYLSEMLGRSVVNLGLSGELAVHAPERLPDVLAQKPYMVLIEFGANDFMQQRSRQAAVSAVEQVVDVVQNAGAIAVIVDTGGPGMDDYTKDYKKLAREKNALFVPGILNGIFNKRALKSDVVHPNAEGYKLVAQKVHKVIAPYVK